MSTASAANHAPGDITAPAVIAETQVLPTGAELPRRIGSYPVNRGPWVHDRLTPAGTEWMATLRERGTDPLCRDAAPRERAIADRLLQIGGHYACMPRVEDDATALLARGATMRYPVRTVAGEPCHCHRNACAWWEHDSNRYQICTGYGLTLHPESQMGVWRQHSWVLDRQRRGIIETTVRRQLYWGLVMTDREARAFAEDNW